MTLWQLLAPIVQTGTPIALPIPGGFITGTPRRVLLRPDGTCELDLAQATHITRVEIPALRSARS